VTCVAIGGWRLLRGGPGTRSVPADDFTLAEVRAAAGLAPRLPADFATWGVMAPVVARVLTAAVAEHR